MTDPEPAAPGLSRRVVLAGGLAAAATPFVPGLVARADAEAPTTTSSTTTTAAPGLTASASKVPADDGATSDYGFLPPRPATEKHVRPIMFPVLGTCTWSDTYLAPRAGGRHHEGQDLIADKMQKILACCDQTIVELKWEAAGNALYCVDDDGWYYAYLHINNDDPGTDNGANQFKYAFAPGMAVGKRVLKGQHIAYVGDSGDAEETVSHCHFEIREPNAHWYNAAAVNAKYSLDAAQPAALRPVVPASAFKPFSGAQAFVLEQAADFLGALPPAPWFDRSVEDLQGAEVSQDAFIEGMLAQTGHQAITQPLIRLYLGFFLRIPDYDGLDYWIRKVRAGTPIATAASQFAGGSEFARDYGRLSNAAFVDRVYRNLFDRAPDASGADYWTRRLDGGAKRGFVMTQLCESNEYRTKTLHQMRVISIYLAMLHRAPDASGYAYWAKKDAASPTGLQQLIKSLRTGTAYAARF